MVHKIRNQNLGPCLTALKERQGQNWPGKNVLPNFSMKIKVTPFVFTNHPISVKINLFFITWGPFKVDFGFSRRLAKIYFFAKVWKRETNYFVDLLLKVDYRIWNFARGTSENNYTRRKFYQCRMFAGRRRAERAQFKAIYLSDEYSKTRQRAVSNFEGKTSDYANNVRHTKQR